MGQSKKNNFDLGKLFDSLNAEEKIVFNLSKKIFDKVIRGMSWGGACYQMTFLSKMLLKNEFGIESDAVIGYINDGTDDFMISHAWLEHKGRKIDVAIANQNGGPPAPILILNHEFQKHHPARYTYHTELNDTGKMVLNEILRSGTSEEKQLVRQKEYEHQSMVEIGLSDKKIMDYLRSAPGGTSYDELAKLLLPL